MIVSAPDWVVPLGLVLFGLCGYVFFWFYGRRVDRQMREERGRHPAE